MRMLITAGPTREYLDDVRFISNGSSGAMGLAIAEEAVRRGHEVTLVLGPTHLKPMYGVRVIPAVSSDEMTEKSLAELSDGYDVLVSAAAIGDFTPERKIQGKISSAGEFPLLLKPTRKLIREAKERFRSLRIVAFKAEYGKDEAGLEAAAKRLLDCADIVVANDVSKDIFGSSETEALMVSSAGNVRIPRMSKRDAAKAVLDALG
jgi:phosphopantothenoylcysteine decarboxylase / phosphopantothenate---cysteine ligase